MASKEGIKCAIYARVSTDKQSCDRQIADLRTFADLKGFVIAAEYSDIISGSAKVKSGRERMVREIPKTKIKAILITELSRLGRSLKDLIELLDLLETLQVSVIPINGMAFDWGSPMGKLMISLIGALAEFERELIRERVLSGLEHAKSKGVKLGRAKKTQEKWHATDLAIQQLRDEGFSVSEIAHSLKISQATVSRRIKAIKEMIL